MKKKPRAYPFCMPDGITEKPIYEDMSIEELQDPKYDNSIVIYSRNNSNNLLDDIIEKMNMIPKIIYTHTYIYKQKKSHE